MDYLQYMLCFCLFCDFSLDFGGIWGWLCPWAVLGSPRDSQAWLFDFPILCKSWDYEVSWGLEFYWNQLPGKCCLILALARRFPTWPWKPGGTGWNNNSNDKNPSVLLHLLLTFSCCSRGAHWMPPTQSLWDFLGVLRNLEYSFSCYLSRDLICFIIQDPGLVPHFSFPAQWEKLWDGSPSFPVLLFPRKAAQGCCHRD